MGEQERQRRERHEQEQLEWHKKTIEGQKLIEQATEWIENQKQHIRDYRKRCAEYKTVLENDIKEREIQKHAINQWSTELREKELKTNRDQMEKILNKEQQHVSDRRLDRKKADSLSMQNVQQKRQSNVLQIKSIFHQIITLYRTEIIFRYMKWQL